MEPGASDQPMPSPSNASSLHTDGRICPACGYDLRASHDPRCPECGQTIDLHTIHLSIIPWVHRHSLGRFAAYRKTTVLAIRHSKQLAREISRPVSLSQARAFRLTTVTVGAVPIMAALLMGFCLLLPHAINHPFAYAGEWFVLAAAMIGIWLFFLTSTGVASYWFHVTEKPPDQQERGIALSYYAAAPLAWTPVALLLAALAIGAALWADRLSPGSEFLGVFAGFFVFIAIALVAAELAVTWWASIVLLRRAMHCTPSRAICCAIGLPLAWSALGALSLILLPAACYYFTLVIVSLL